MTVTRLTPRPPTDTAAPGRRGWRTAVLVLLTVLGVGFVAVGIVGALLTGTDRPPGPRTVGSVGHLDGSAAVVAVLARDTALSASVCDTAVRERFTRTLLGDRAVLRSPDGAELTVDLGDGGATGTFTPVGAPTPRPFRTFPGTAPRCVEKVSGSGHVT